MKKPLIILFTTVRRTFWATMRLQSVCKVYAKVYATKFYKNKRKQREIK